jgi:AcrR family transcriptional regulator
MKRKTKRSYDPEGTRGRILDVAAHEFQTRGYNGTGMHRVMRLANVPGGSLYHYFPSKKRLGLAVIEERVAAELERTWLEPVRTAASPASGIGAVFDAVAASAERSRAVSGCPVNNLTLELAFSDGDFQRVLGTVFELWRKEVAARLGDDALATLVVAAFSGAMSLAKASQSAEPIRACKRQLMRLLRRNSRTEKSTA